MKIRALEETAVHEEILIAKPLSCRVWTTDISAYIHNRSLRRHINDFICHIGSKHILYSELQGLGWAKDIDIPAVVGQCESYLRTCQSNSCELRHNMFELDIIRLQELTSCRNIVKQIPDTEISTPRRRNLLCINMLRVCKIHLTADLILFSAGLESHLSNRCDRSKRFSTETKGQYLVKILSCSKFGCRMPLETEHRLIR